MCLSRERTNGFASFCARICGSRCATFSSSIRLVTVRVLLLILDETHNHGDVHGVNRALWVFLRWWEMETGPQDWFSPLHKVKLPRVNQPPLEPVSFDDLRAMLWLPVRS